MRHVLLAVMLALAIPAFAAAPSDQTIRLAIGALPPQLGNPFATAATPSITVTSALFDGLTRVARDGTLKPWLATAWRRLDDHTWRFELRRDVKFSNGEPFTAAAVAAAVNYLAGPAVNPGDNLKRELPALTGAKVVDDFTVDISTADLVPLFPRYASMLVVPEPKSYAALGRDGFMKTPVGTGPFMIEAFVPGKAMFTAFAGSWRKPKAQRLEVIMMPEKSSRVQAIQTGAADIAVLMDPEDGPALAEVGGKLISYDDASVQGITLVSTRDLPFKDVRVRRALNMAVNRAPLVDILLHGATVPANQPVTRNALGYNPDIPAYVYDPAKAKALLTEAGYAKGFSFTLETTGTGAGMAQVFQQVSSDLAAVGVKMEIRMLPTSQYLTNIFQTGNYADAISLPWGTAPTLDALRAVNIHSCTALHPWYCDPAITPKIQAASVEAEDAKALQLRREIMAYYHDQAPAIFLYEQVIFAGLSARVHGFADTFGSVNYDEITLD